MDMGKYRILCFANQKGGVGKTTSAVNVAACLARAGKKVLLVDADPQGNATSGIGVSKRELESTVYDVLIGEKTVEETVVETSAKNLFLLPSGIDLVGAELELADEPRREYRLKDALERVREEYDYIIIDCPPALGLVTINTLVAADGVIIPMQCEYYSLEGLSQLMMSVKQIKKRYNPALALTGILITMYNGRLNLSTQVMDELKKYYAGKIFKTAVVRNVKLSEAPSHGKPITAYDRTCRGAEAYTALAAEFLKKQR